MEQGQWDQRPGAGEQRAELSGEQTGGPAGERRCEPCAGQAPLAEALALL